MWKQYTITWDHIWLNFFVNGVLTDSSNAAILEKRKKGNLLAIGTDWKAGSRSTQMEMHFDDLMIWESYLDNRQVMSQYKSGEVINFKLGQKRKSWKIRGGRVI